MAVVDHDDLHTHAGAPSEKMCAIQFCAMWIGFFVLIGAFSWLVSSL